MTVLLLALLAVRSGPFYDAYDPAPGYGHMMVHENTDAYSINTQNSWHCPYTASDWVTGDTMLNVTFEDGSSKSITAYADAGGSPNSVTVTSALHGFSDGDFISISGTTNYNNVYEVQNAAANTFTIVSAFGGDDATGTADKCPSLTLTYGGSYDVHYSASAAGAAGSNVFDVVLFAGTSAGLPEHEGETEGRFTGQGVGAYFPVGGGGLHALSAGDKIVLAVMNTSGTGNITFRYINVWLHRVD